MMLAKLLEIHLHSMARLSIGLAFKPPPRDLVIGRLEVAIQHRNCEFAASGSTLHELEREISNARVHDMPEGSTGEAGKFRVGRKRKLQQRTGIKRKLSPLEYSQMLHLPFSSLRPQQTLSGEF